MKVVIENLVTTCKVKDQIDLEEIAESIEGARYQPEVFDGISYESDDPSYKSFIMKDGKIRFHGLTSEEGAREAMEDLLSRPSMRNTWLEERLSIKEVIASVDLDGPVDAKSIYEEFKDEGIVYDPEELPGFILNMGRSGIEVLIFPEGKVISKGATNILDSVSSLQMVYNRIKGNEEGSDD